MRLNHHHHWPYTWPDYGCKYCTWNSIPLHIFHDRPNERDEEEEEAGEKKKERKDNVVAGERPEYAQ